MSTHSTGHNFGSVQIKPMEFVDKLLILVGRKLVLLQVVVFWRLFSMNGEYLSQQKNVNH